MAKKSKKSKKIMFSMRAAIAVQHMGADGNIDLNALERRDDGSAIFNVQPMRTGSYDYLAFELPRSLTSQFGRDLDFDSIVVGEIEPREVRKILSTFEALPVTNEHVFINPNNTDEIAGRVLQNGKLQSDGHVSTRLVIESADLLAEIETGRMVEVSIGFFANEPVVNENRQEGEPDFFIRGIELNHLAVVRRGRAGPGARLSHDVPMFVHGFNDNFHSSEVSTMKIKIANKDYEVSDDVAQAIKSEQDAAQTEITNAKSERDEARTALTDAQDQVNTLKGENAALKTQQGDEVNVQEEAQKLVAQHEELTGMLKTLGSKTELAFGKYDAADELRKALTEFGVTEIENSDYDSLASVFQGIKTTLGRKTGQGALEGAHGSPTQYTATSFGNGQKQDRGQSRVEAKIKHGLSGKANKTKGDS